MRDKFLNGVLNGLELENVPLRRWRLNEAYLESIRQAKRFTRGTAVNHSLTYWCHTRAAGEKSLVTEAQPSEAHCGIE